MKTGWRRKGFPTHSHRDNGNRDLNFVGRARAPSEQHGNGSVIDTGDVQRRDRRARASLTANSILRPMTAVHLLQIWIMPSAKTIWRPGYEQKSLLATKNEREDCA
jgi:redox-sensitive bicupin YhaK (pirin superfamily)